ncbi:MAG: dienelactone hydrolase family protein [Microscillaceae bacterium]|nr:dienelactone hydrolase family protein [Microscillaceae bacterium]MDW8460910.1 dienelactone hydrolase family protein [Cytophagales bacterium]
MKKLLLFLAFVFFLLAQCQAPYEYKCCNIEMSATTSFALLGLNKGFVKSHNEPQPSHFQPTLGEKVSFATPDGRQGQGFLIQATQKTNKYLFVFHEWWGLNDYIKQESEKLAKDLNVNVLALDLYDGEVATKREEAAKLMQSVKPKRAVSIIQGAIQYVGKRARIATIGWCFGGGWSLQAALLTKKQAVACIIYYGMPERDKKKLKTLQAPVLGIFAGREKWINAEIVKEFEENLKTLKKQAIIKTFDAEHAFANPSNPNYHKEYTEQAYQISLEFLRKNL